MSQTDNVMDRDLLLIQSILDGEDSPPHNNNYRNHTDSDHEALLLTAIIEGEDSPPFIENVSHEEKRKQTQSSDNNDGTNNSSMTKVSKSEPSQSTTKKAPSTILTSHRKRKLGQRNIEKDDNYNSIQQFKQKNHSLYLSASQIAGMVGLNPYTNLPKLCMDLVYQGQMGRQLLSHDAKLLNLTLVDEEESLLQIASKGGKDVKKALDESIKIANGIKNVTSIENAKEIKKDIVKKIQDSKNKLSKGEVKLLLDGMRHNVNTGFGKSHEENALDLYEKQCGWQVRQRNAERKCWKFMRLEDLGENYGSINEINPSTMKTVVPIGQSKSVIRCDNRPHSPISDKRKEVPCSSSSSNNEVVEILSSQEDDNTSPQVDTKMSIVHKTNIGPQNESANRYQPPFFSINGVVDGIRDELYHIPSVPSIIDGTGISNHDLHPHHMELKYSDDDDWGLREVVVECKHRMNKAFNPPPIYDQIQAVIYAFMYETSEAEIVQVVRNNETDCTDSESLPESKANVTEKVNQDIGQKKEQLEKEQESNRKTKSITSISISSHRVSLDEPVMNHRQNWNHTVLPRLRSFVDAVYSIRGNDDKRYRLLQATAIAASSGNENDCWTIIHDECPWLLECDTAFSRLGQFS